MIGVSLLASATTASSSGLDPASRPTRTGVEVECLLNHLPLLVDLDGVHAGVAARVLVLSDSPLERFVDILKPIREDVVKPDKRRETDASALQIVDQLFEVDRPAGVLGRMDLDLSVPANRKVALSPSRDFVQLRCIRSSPGLAHIMGGRTRLIWIIHADDIDFLASLQGFARSRSLPPLPPPVEVDQNNLLEHLREIAYRLSRGAGRVKSIKPLPPINDDAFLVIERDNFEGAAAAAAPPCHGPPVTHMLQVSRLA
jgi:hypothetical protein